MTTDPKDLQNIASAANTIPIKDVAPNLVKEAVTKEQCEQFLIKLGESHGLSTPLAFIAFALLCLKGACNKSSPKEMQVDIHTGEGSPINITKYDLEHICFQLTGNFFLRRFAQAMAPEISAYAEKHNLNGDLAIRINNLALANGGPPLNSREKSWANSFCQSVSDLSDYAGERLPSLLAEDFQKRFGGKKDKKKPQKPENLNPRQWRKGKPKGNSQGNPQGNSPPNATGQNTSIPQAQRPAQRSGQARRGGTT
jgi:hypothetical protein